MMLTMHALSVEVFTDMLGDLSKILDKAAEHARAERIDPATLVGARLAPDMFDLAKQVQAACHQATNGTARLAGVEPPVFKDDETTLDALKARIARTIDYLSGFDAHALEGAEERQITIPTPFDFVFEMTGLHLLKDWALPHFFFHVTTAYDILRHKGVVIGKQDYLGHMAAFMRPKSAA
jgi:uncharacterized protein